MFHPNLVAIKLQKIGHSTDILENTVNTKVPGTYKVTYKVTDSNSNTTTKTINVVVKTNSAPVINASDKTIYVNDSFDPKAGVTASDAEDGNITNKIIVTTNTVNNNNVSGLSTENISQDF